jgi:hypothetical protein
LLLQWTLLLKMKRIRQFVKKRSKKHKLSAHIYINLMVKVIVAFLTAMNLIVLSDLLGKLGNVRDLQREVYIHTYTHTFK